MDNGPRLVWALGRRDYGKIPLMDDELTQREFVEQLNTRVTEELRNTFEQIAKLALQGSAEANDGSLTVVQKMRKAHARVTLIIDDAMTGLATVSEIMLTSGVVIGAVSSPSAEG